MFDLRIPVTLANIKMIKANLLRALPDVKSSHRVEAMARGFGFSTNAALCAALKSDSELGWKPNKSIAG